VPPAHVPPEQASPIVQTLPSSQGFELLTWMHPSDGSQLSVVQSLSSLQSSKTLPEQTPLEHVSPEVQTLASSHEVPSALAGLEHCPVWGSQTP
jgi:hypothetical protein